MVRQEEKFPPPSKGKGNGWLCSRSLSHFSGHQCPVPHSPTAQHQPLPVAWKGESAAGRRRRCGWLALLGFQKLVCYMPGPPRAARAAGPEPDE